VFCASGANKKYDALPGPTEALLASVAQPADDVDTNQ
jgi:hypothetical protein